MALRRPPQHAADAAPIFIAPTDDAWDIERIKRERAALKNDNAEVRDAVALYYSGETRYDLDAPVTIGGQIVTPRHYLREGSTPTVFHLRRDAPTALKRAQALAVFGDLRAREAAWWDLARSGIAKITDGFTDGAPWKLEGGGPFPLTDADLMALHDAGRGLVQDVGLAVFYANAPLSDTEGKL
jgi:hypothetical protein